jgi:hypothetical protein
VEHGQNHPNPSVPTFSLVEALNDAVQYIHRNTFSKEQIVLYSTLDACICIAQNHSDTCAASLSMHKIG